MKISPQVRIFPSLMGGLDLVDFALVLDQIPQPAFLINPAADQILLANAFGSAYTGWTTEELQNSSLHAIFPGLPTSIGGNDFSSFSCELMNSKGSKFNGEARLQPLPKRSHWVLLVFRPAETHPDLDNRTDSWQYLLQVFELANDLLLENPIHVLLSHALETLMQLSTSENGYLYTALANQTNLTCTSYREATAVFPHQLSVHALMEISSPSIWTDTHPATTHLAQIAQEHGQRYLIALPLGESKARVGLILLSGGKEYRDLISAEEWGTLTSYLSSLIQLFYQTRNLEKELSVQSRENSIHRRLLNAIQEGVILLNQDQRVLYLNSAAETILGYTCAEAVNQPVQTFLISERDLSFTLPTTLRGTFQNQIRSVRLYRRSGQSFLADLQFIPLHIDQKVNGTAIIIQDRTEQETLLKQSMRMEQRAVLGEFTTLFAHEARNPINNITANLQWMAMNLPADDPNQAIIQRIQQNCERLNDLMDTILAYNRISEMEMETIDIKSLLKKTLDRQSIHLKQANIQLNYETSENIPAIKGNRRALERVFANLIDNAMHSMKDNGGNLTIKIHPTQLKDPLGEWLEISIADSGPGIPDEYKEKLFKESFTTKSNGTGIGLMICHKILQAHKGMIDYQSIPGGTVFIVRLPLTSTQEPSLTRQE